MNLLLRDPASIPDTLPGEPPSGAATGVGLWARVALGLATLPLVAAAAVPLWLPYLALVALYGRPPVALRAAQVRRYVNAILHGQPPAPGLTLARRLYLLVLVLRKAVMVPLPGLAWLLDEVLYGRRLDAVPLEAPLFEVSAGRSGSTQLARYFEDDPRLAAPSLLLAMFPYLWLHRLVRSTVGRFVSADTVRRKIEATLPTAFVERHEVDPFRTDTFDGALFIAHLNSYCFFVGPDMAAEDFAMGRAAPVNRALWEEDFVVLLERIGRKRLFDAGPGPDGAPRRLFVKGHFLAGAPALARRFPDARFFTMLREPAPRFQSGINYIRVNPIDPVLGPPAWPWLVAGALRTEVEYCQVEKAWFTAPDGPRRCVLRFHEYLADLPGTLRRVYAECLDSTPPPDAPTEHPPRRRSHYQVDRSLEQLGIDAVALHLHLADYVAWCRGYGAG